ncbi:hypothetical protein BH11PSE4_BH11PSE4_20440 [soil metagenome]
MIKHLAIIAVAAAGICSAVPASAEQIGVGIGPGGVTVGAVPDRHRDREYIRERDHRDRDRGETVIIRKDRRDRDYDGDRRTVIERD